MERSTITIQMTIGRRINAALAITNGKFLLTQRAGVVGFKVMTNSDIKEHELLPNSRLHNNVTFMCSVWQMKTLKCNAPLPLATSAKVLASAICLPHNLRRGQRKIRWIPEKHRLESRSRPLVPVRITSR